MTQELEPLPRLADLAAEGRPHLLYGRDLRYQLTQLVTERGAMSVAGMAEAIDALGFEIDGRPSKVISDALRWEIGRGRLVRIGRGRYRLGMVPRSTAYRIARNTRIRRQLLAKPTAA